MVITRKKFLGWLGKNYANLKIGEDVDFLTLSSLTKLYWESRHGEFGKTQALYWPRCLNIDTLLMMSFWRVVWE